MNDRLLSSGNVSCLLLLLGALTQAIRNFAKSLESWLTNAMMNIPEEMVRIKVHHPCAVFLMKEIAFRGLETTQNNTLIICRCNKLL